jgi:hypothetical protein
VKDRHCTHCGGTDLRAGVLETGWDAALWAGTATDPGWRAALNPRPRFRVTAYRCANCAHIDLFAESGD